MTERLLRALATTEALDAAFSDRAMVDGMLRFEVALARAQAEAGLIPNGVVEAIAGVPLETFDPSAIAAAARTSGTIAIAFVDAVVADLKRRVPDAAKFAHRGATSQDVTDTALVLCLRRAAEILHRDHQRLTAALRRLSDRHHDTVMLARTLLQPATPTTFGLKAAGWFAGVAHAHAWMARAFEEARVLQFGGPAGTLAVLGEHGPAIAERMAIELELTWPGAPWHTERHRFAAVAAACGIYTGALGKIARDVALLMQFEVGEAAEPGGGSSSMPHKRNPAACALILAAAARVPALAATLFSTMTQEHERGVGGWHAEAITLADIVQTTGSALAGAADVAEHLTVDADRMRRNLEAARGTVFPGSDAPDTHLGSAEVFRRRLLDRN